jgi:hypothetical protein
VAWARLGNHSPPIGTKISGSDCLKRRWHIGDPNGFPQRDAGRGNGILCALCSPAWGFWAQRAYFGLARLRHCCDVRPTRTRREPICPRLPPTRPGRAGWRQRGVGHPGPGCGGRAGAPGDPWSAGFRRGHRRNGWQLAQLTAVGSCWVRSRWQVRQVVRSLRGVASWPVWHEAQVAWPAARWSPGKASEPGFP